MANNDNTTPSITKTAFNCPHCGAFTTQDWFNLISKPYLGNDQRTPNIPVLDTIIDIETDPVFTEEKNQLIEWCKNIKFGKPFFEKAKNIPGYTKEVANCNISQCYNCKEITVWVYDQIVYPNTKIDIQPNNDLPDHIRRLFEEAREIVNTSPKGSSAILRLCIQHLCKELGESGKNLDNDIAGLVNKGLNPLVQKALIITKVIGKGSVLPGKINLKDNKELALKLFDLVNIICDQMITHPKQVKELYAGLPSKNLNLLFNVIRKLKKNNKAALELKKGNEINR